MLAAGFQELEKPQRLLDYRRPLGLRYRFYKRSDDETDLLGQPHRAYEAVDQDRALHDPVAAEHPEVLARGQDARAVGVAEQDVVEVGQESHRHVDAWVRARGLRQVEQLAALGIPEGFQARPQALEDLAYRQAGPRAHVRRRGGTGHGEGAANEVVRLESGARRPPEPCLEGR